MLLEAVKIPIVTTAVRQCGLVSHLGESLSERTLVTRRRKVWMKAQQPARVGPQTFNPPMEVADQ